MEREGIAVVVHNIVVAGPIVSVSHNVAKFAAAERALGILKNRDSEKALSALCDCAMAMAVDIDTDQRDISELEDEEEIVGLLTHFM